MNLIPFESKTLPAYLQNANTALNDDLMTGVGVGGGGFAVLSIKGKVFTIVKNRERTVVTRPDDPDEAATALEVVIVRANKNLSKVYYTAGYEDGATSKPDCYSNDGAKPAADSATPQAKTCAACKHNVWGTGNGGKGFACQSSRRIAIAAAGNLEAAMLLRIPPATLTPLAEYAKLLKSKGVTADMVVTKIRFDREEATPKLTFTPVGILPDTQYEQVRTLATTEIVESIIGIRDGDAAEADTAGAPAARAADPELDAALAPAKKAKPAPVDDDEPAPAPVKKAKPAPVDDDLDSILESLDD